MSIIEKRKQKKMNLVFTTVRENPDYTKTEIKASTGLSMESVIQYVDTLVQDNCLYYITNITVSQDIIQPIIIIFYVSFTVNNNPIY